MNVGGESFAEEARTHLEGVWNCPVYNTYGSTEGTMCGECRVKNGLHCPEDLVHVDLYDPAMERFVRDGEKGRLVLTTLIPVGEKAGTLLINYDTEDNSRVLTRDRCACGRTHMKIEPPWRDAETVVVHGCAINRIDIERAVFQPENMKSITGEYEAFLYGDGDETTLRVSMECIDPAIADKAAIKRSFFNALFHERPELSEIHEEGQLSVIFNFTPVERPAYRIGVPEAGRYQVLLNTDSEGFGGAGHNPSPDTADATPWHDQPCSLTIDLPGLSAVVLKRGGD